MTRSHVASTVLILFLAAALPPLAPAPAPAEQPPADILLHEKFSPKLAGGWTWVREDKSAWRLTGKGLEIRIQPGNMWGGKNDAKNLLKRDLPDASRGAVAAEVTVTVRGTEPYEQAGLTWYFDDSNMVKLVVERVNGKTHIVMGREEGDRTRTIDLHPIEGETFRLRLEANGTKITGSYRKEDEAAWRDAGSCDLPGKEGAKLCLQAYNGPEKGEHWAVFSDLKVLVPRGERPPAKSEESEKSAKAGPP